MLRFFVLFALISCSPRPISSYSQGDDRGGEVISHESSKTEDTDFLFCKNYVYTKNCIVETYESKGRESTGLFQVYVMECLNQMGAVEDKIKKSIENKPDLNTEIEVHHFAVKFARNMVDCFQTDHTFTLESRNNQTAICLIDLLEQLYKKPCRKYIK